MFLRMACHEGTMDHQELGPIYAVLHLGITYQTSNISDTYIMIHNGKKIVVMR